MSATPDLWELGAAHDFNHPDYYIDQYNGRTKNILFIKKNYYSKPEHRKAIIDAFYKAGHLNKSSQTTGKHYELRMGKKEGYGNYEEVKTYNNLGKYISLSSPKQRIPVYNPGDYDENTMEPINQPSSVAIRESTGGTSSASGGGTAFKKTAMKKQVFGRERVIYLGARNRQYVKLKGTFVPIRSA